MRVGIFAMQGAVEPHRAKLAALGAEPVFVRTTEDLSGCAGLILPGGESTTLLRLIGVYGMMAPLLDFASTRPLWGVCAGSILMAATVENPPQESMGLLPVTVRRNAYGRQNESFIAEVELRLPGGEPAVQESVYIRAPQITVWDETVTVLGAHAGLPVAIAHAHHMATTFHPELSPPETLHRHFLALCGEAERRASA